MWDEARICRGGPLVDGNEVGDLLGVKNEEGDWDCVDGQVNEDEEDC